MTVSSVVDIVHGELLNTPSITRVEQIRVDAKKVKRGDLFISLLDADIQTALENGAYAVVVPKNRVVKDDETAWIGVEDTNAAMLLLLRYLLVQKNIRFFHCDEPLFTLASSMLYKNRNLLMLDGSVFNLVDMLIDREGMEYCLSADRSLLERLASSVETLSLCSEQADVGKESLFQTEMIFQDHRYLFPVASRLNPYLATLIAFSKEHGLELSWDTSRSEGVFQTFYLNRSLEISTTATDKVVIIDQPFSAEYIQGSRAFLNDHFKWGKTVALSDTPMDGMREFASLEELNVCLHDKRFNFAYILTSKPESVILKLSETPDRSGGNLF